MPTLLRYVPEEAKLWEDSHGRPIAIAEITIRCLLGTYLLKQCCAGDRPDRKQQLARSKKTPQGRFFLPVSHRRCKARLSLTCCIQHRSTIDHH